MRRGGTSHNWDVPTVTDSLQVAGQQARDVAALDGRAAACGAYDVFGIVSAEEAARHVAGGVQTFDHLAVCSQHLAVLRDAQAVERGQVRSDPPNQQP